MTKPKLEIANVAAEGKAAEPKLEITTETEAKADAPVVPSVAKEELDADEAEFRKLRRDLPGVKGASAAGIVSVGVSKLPGGRKNEFFRTHLDFRPVVPLVDIEVGMEKQYFAVDNDMVVALAGIGISVAEHTLYLTITPLGAYRIIPIHCSSDNDYTRTKEIGLLEGEKEWVRIYTDQENKVYKVFPAAKERYADPIWPVLQPAKIFRLAFRDKGRLVDSSQHPLFLKWAALDKAAR